MSEEELESERQFMSHLETELAQLRAETSRLQSRIDGLDCNYRSLQGMYERREKCLESLTEDNQRLREALEAARPIVKFSAAALPSETSGEILDQIEAALNPPKT